MYALLGDFRLDAAGLPGDIDERIAEAVTGHLALKPGELRQCRIENKSIDSRRGRPALLYTLLLELDDRAAAAGKLEALPPEALAKRLAPPTLEFPDTSLLHPVVVGTGPAGIFAALALALAGTRPLVLDRGPEVEERFAGYERFLATRELDEAANLLIGEGGAGTFSDGKLYTGTRDPRAAFVLDAFIRAGAPAEIRYLKRPHIGSDRLRPAAAALRRRIVELGGSFRFHSEVAEVLEAGGRCVGVRLADGEQIAAPAVFIAPGLGGRDFVRRLAARGVAAEVKSFQIGCRVEHPQAWIDRRQYRIEGSRPAALGAAEYHLVSHSPKAPSVSSFCMCPGGEVLNATAWRGRSLTNGMSDYARGGEFGNGCLIITLPPEHFGGDREAAYALLEKLERSVFAAGGGDYTLPAQDAEAFLGGRTGLRNRQGSSRIGLVPGRLDRLMPEELAAGIRAALRHFDRLSPGFIREGKLIGLETCVSSPLRFLRDPATGASSLPGLYLGGEGVGCAGGILSAAVDGIRQAEAMLR